MILGTEIFLFAQNIGVMAIVNSIKKESFQENSILDIIIRTGYMNSERASCFFSKPEPLCLSPNSPVIAHPPLTSDHSDLREIYLAVKTTKMKELTSQQFLAQKQLLERSRTFIDEHAKQYHDKRLV